MLNGSFGVWILTCPLFAQTPILGSQGLAGYISMEVSAPPEGFGYGVSLYAAAWPLVEKPLRDFQIGLASIWIVPENLKVDYPLLPPGTVARDNWPERGPSYRDVFQTIEGGLGFWASTQFPSTTAKFRMNGTANGYNQEVSSPGWGFGQTKSLEPGEMGIAQLSRNLLVPPDGLTFKSGTCGELMGYAWMVLPLTDAQSRTAGQDIPTGDQCWTMFLNAKNFSGPVAFYTPTTWSKVSLRHPPAVARGLDARPGLVTGGAIEVNTVPCFTSGIYSKIPQLQFPADRDGKTVLIHKLTHYSKGAVYDQFASWIAGGKPSTGKFAPKGSSVPSVRAHPLAVRQGAENLEIKGVENWVVTKALSPQTFGLQWQPAALSNWKPGQQKGSFPSNFKRVGSNIFAVKESAIPAENNLHKADFPSAVSVNTYDSPQTKESVWANPGPAAGPYRVRLSDGSVLTYFWYKFVNQPSLQNAGLSPKEKAKLQSTVEKIHHNWTIGKTYMSPPDIGKLAALDPALIVNPPKGLEVGYVPIVTKQAPGKGRSQ